MRSPSLIAAVAPVAPTTAGIPYSRATMAQWLSSPPVSVTTAAAVAKSGVHGGEVVGVTRISPGCNRLPSAIVRLIRATPFAVPRDPGLPGIWLATADGAFGTEKNRMIARVTGLSGGGP